jgi:hypothetical protein
MDHRAITSGFGVRYTMPADRKKDEPPGKTREDTEIGYATLEAAQGRAEYLRKKGYHAKNIHVVDFSKDPYHPKRGR